MKHSTVGAVELSAAGKLSKIHSVGGDDVKRDATYSNYANREVFCGCSILDGCDCDSLARFGVACSFCCIVLALVPQTLATMKVWRCSSRRRLWALTCNDS